MPNEPLQGPRVHYRPPDDGIAAPPDYPDAPISLVLERSTAGAHGIRNTGSLPLQLLSVYPSPGGHLPPRAS